MSPLRRLFAVAALIAFGLLLALGTLEAALRIYDAMKTKPPVARGTLWKPTEGYGWLHFADREARWFDARGEFSLTVKINSLGLRDVEHDYAKPPGVYRILILGDSYMEAVQVELDKIFPRLLERTLNEGGRRVEVINGSAAEWGTDNELIFFLEEGLKYSPDLVLLAFTTANDVRNNSIVLNALIPNPNLYKPSFTMTPDGELDYRPTRPLPPSPPPPPWWRQFRVAEFFANRLGVGTIPLAALTPLPLPPPPPPPAVPGPGDPPATKVPIDMLVYQSPSNRDVLEGWRVTKALILRLQDEVVKHGAKFAMFLVNGPWAHYQEYWNLMTMKDPVALKTWSRRTPNDVLDPFLREKQITFLDLFPEFEAKKAVEPLYFRYDPHWTPAGHRLAADTVARFLVDNALVPDAKN